MELVVGRGSTSEIYPFGIHQRSNEVRFDVNARPASTIQEDEGDVRLMSD